MAKLFSIYIDFLSWFVLAQVYSLQVCTEDLHRFGPKNFPIHQANHRLISPNPDNNSPLIKTNPNNIIILLGSIDSPTHPQIVLQYIKNPPWTSMMDDGLAFLAHGQKYWQLWMERHRTDRKSMGF